MNQIIKFPANDAGTTNPTFPPDYQNREARRHGKAVPKSFVLEALGISSPTLYRLINAGLFPQPLKIGYRMSRWFESDVDDFLAKADADRQSVSA